MRCRNASLSVLLAVSGCVAVPASRDAPLREWFDYVASVEEFEPAELAGERASAWNELLAQPSDANRLRVGYLLSRPGASVDDVGRGLALIAGIGATSVYAPVGEWIERSVALRVNLEAATQRATALEIEVETLREQLEALKAIEADLSRDQKEIEELSE